LADRSLVFIDTSGSNTPRTQKKFAAPCASTRPGIGGWALTATRVPPGWQAAALADPLACCSACLTAD
jgi:hypothetical protein